MSILRREIDSIPTSLLAAAEHGQPAIAQAAADWQANQPSMLMTVARGTSDAAATFAAHEFTRLTKTPVGSFTPSLASLGGFTHTDSSLRVLAISQSGQSPDLVAALGSYAEGSRWALTNIDNSPLGQLANVRIPIGAGEETSVAATKSFICSLLQIHSLALACVGSSLPAAQPLADAAAQGLNEPLKLDSFAKATSAFVLGRGTTLCLAQEAAIKIKELSGLHAEAISAAEVMHGPKALAGPQLPVLAFAPLGEVGDSVREACSIMRELGSTVVLHEATGVDDFAALLNALASFYIAVPELARARGHDPDNPTTLTKVTETR